MLPDHVGEHRRTFPLGLGLPEPQHQRGIGLLLVARGYRRHPIPGQSDLLVSRVPRLAYPHVRVLWDVCANRHTVSRTSVFWGFGSDAPFVTGSVRIGE
jgi:hypothetical protein